MFYDLVLLRIPDFRDRDIRIFKPILKKGFESDPDLSDPNPQLTSAGKILDFRDQVGFDSSAYFLGSRTESGFVRLRPDQFGSRTK
jgi:hypothetical protein